MSQESYTWSEMADLTHATQVKLFNFCLCEDLDERQEAPYTDCPIEGVK